MKIIPYILAFSLIGCGTGDDGSNGANCFDSVGDVNDDGVTDTKDCIPLIPEDPEEDTTEADEEAAKVLQQGKNALAMLYFKQRWADVTPEARDFIIKNAKVEQIGNLPLSEAVRYVFDYDNYVSIDRSTTINNGEWSVWRAFIDGVDVSGYPN